MGSRGDSCTTQRVSQVLRFSWSLQLKGATLCIPLLPRKCLVDPICPLKTPLSPLDGAPYSSNFMISCLAPHRKMNVQKSGEFCCKVEVRVQASINDPG